MGFGWLFIGYFLTIMNIPMFGIFGTIIRTCGFALVLFAAVKLRKYNRSFNLSIIGSGLMIGISTLIMTVNVDSILVKSGKLTQGFLSITAKNIINCLDIGATLIFTVFLLWGVYNIAKETEVKKISNGSIRNTVFLGLYYVVLLISYIPINVIQKERGTFVFISWVLYFVYAILNIILLFDCYAKICDEDDIEMERRPSRFAIINQFNEEFDRRSQKAREEDAAYRLERRERRKRRKNK